MELGQRNPLEVIKNFYHEEPEKNKETLESKAEKKMIALQAVMDGTFEGAIFDGSTLSKAIIAGAELTVSQTTYKDYKSRPISEVVVSMKDSQNKVLSEIVVGFVVSDLSDLENIVKFN